MMWAIAKGTQPIIHTHTHTHTHTSYMSKRERETEEEKRKEEKRREEKKGKKRKENNRKAIRGSHFLWGKFEDNQNFSSWDDLPETLKTAKR